ncbi:4a-hydroxytetrahydrobiopterin dehydratase [Rhizobium alvei]|uniref:Putative pterin-4-alpha-carbinolamine dehydratase n=1 Tax=Rhizobium alvei TaxID=1132659 RepID=A0ABT8YNQ9_9HYPH|nr:4a-hydroxytetrahydrobiopterin dehydratase [Rhizobium alvei]MDO6964855.1 4a-hydroxytetrahydrobiopterin dehydratase [Rhizobium alvei]
MARQRLSSSEIAEIVQALPDWSIDAAGTGLLRTYRFESFASAIGFMTECAIFADKIDHHPEWKNVYKTVEVRLTTHSAHGITELDRDLAKYMEEVARRH